MPDPNGSHYLYSSLCRYVTIFNTIWQFSGNKRLTLTHIKPCLPNMPFPPCFVGCRLRSEEICKRQAVYFDAMQTKGRGQSVEYGRTGLNLARANTSLHPWVPWRQSSSHFCRHSSSVSCKIIFTLNKRRQSKLRCVTFIKICRI